MKDAKGSYGEFLRVDLTGNYGDLGANMQAVTWTYYGNDSTYSNVKATYGTKFAADNWMHKTKGISAGSDQIPEMHIAGRNRWNRLLDDHDCSAGL